MEKTLTSDPELVAKLSNYKSYDYVIVGSGFGGGILAEELVKKKKKVLLLERGGLEFTTHVCNTARPDFSRGTADAPEGNELVFANEKAIIPTAQGSDTYVGGPMYCLGGRSNVWGMWCPKIEEATLDEYFPPKVAGYIKSRGNDDAFNLMSNDSQKNAIYPEEEFGPPGKDNALESARANLHEAVKAWLIQGRQLHVGPVAIQFKSPGPFKFPQGGYSTTTALLNRMYARDEYLTVLLHAEVLEFEYPRDGSQGKPYSASALLVRSLVDQKIYRISTTTSKVVLSAGTLGTAKIALNSGLQFQNKWVGKGLVDHEVYAMRCAQEKPAGATPKSKEPMLFQAMINLGGRRALLSVTYNSNFFLAGSSRLSIKQFWNRDGSHKIPILKGIDKIQDEDFDTVALLLEFHAELDNNNEVLSLPSSEPTIRFKRNNPMIDEEFQEEMQALATKVRDSTLNLKTGAMKEFLAPRPTLLGLGVFAHETGTMRMDGPKGDGVVDENLQVKGFDNLFVCDLSVLPVSTEANPTRTLVAIVLRLSEYLEPTVEIPE